MDRNPYTPPSAEVADVVDVRSPARPLSVTTAVQLFWLGFAFELLGWWAPGFGPYLRGEASAVAFFSPLAGFAVAGWLYVKVHAGRNWARITLLVLHVLLLAVLYFSLLEFLTEAATSKRLSVLTRPVLNTIALYLVFVPGRAWFAPR